MADLRGVLPGQRPPIDATVLDEPTSEVPMIRPPGARGGTDVGPDLELERTIKARPAAPESEPEPEPPAEAELAEADLATEAGTTPEETTPEDEITAEDETEPMEAETTVETPEFPEPPAPAVELGLAPTPASTPPVVAAFGGSPAAEVLETVVPGPANGNSEMAKMSWDPPPPPPPGLTTTFPTDLSEPEPADIPELVAVAEPADIPEPVAVAEPAVTVAEPAVTEEPEVIDIPAPAPAPAAPRGPGDVAENAIALWTDDAADRLRGQWRDLQVQFIDDPNAAVNGAKGLVTEAVRELADTLLAAQDELDPFHGTDQVDTESMRVAMRRYREFLDRVLAL